MLAFCEKFIYPHTIYKLVKTMIGKIKGWIKDKAGVSPIIAIILMVAITVVLAATIYVWVSGMGKTGTSTPNLSATINNADNKIIITSAEAGLDWQDIKMIWSGSVTNISVHNADGSTINYATTGNEMDPVSTSSNDVGAGDYIAITGSGNVEVSLIYKPTNTQLGTWTVNV